MKFQLSLKIQLYICEKLMRMKTVCIFYYREEVVNETKRVGKSENSTHVDKSSSSMMDKLRKKCCTK